MIVWRKSSHSGTQDESDCVEVAEIPSRTTRAIGVRDSKNPTGPILTLTPADFRALLDHVKIDALDGIPADERDRPVVRNYGELPALPSEPAPPALSSSDA